MPGHKVSYGANQQKSKYTEVWILLRQDLACGRV